MRDIQAGQYNDVLRMIDILTRRGHKIDDEKCYELWLKVSKEFRKKWVKLPEHDEKLYFYLSKYL